MENKEQKKFYEKTWFIILMLIFICPVGVFLLFKNKKLNKIMKILLIIIAIPYTIIGLATWSVIFSGDVSTTTTSNVEVEKAQEESSNNKKEEEIKEAESKEEIKEEIKEAESNEEVKKSENKKEEKNNSNKLLKGKIKVEDKESMYDAIASVRLSENSLTLLDYLLNTGLDYDVYKDDKSTFITFKYKDTYNKDKEVNVCVVTDGTKASYYYDEKLLEEDGLQMRDLAGEIFGQYAKIDYYVGKTAHSTKTNITKNNSVLIGLTMSSDISVETILSSKTTQYFYDNGSESIGDLLTEYGYSQYYYNKDLCKVENQGNGQYYVSIAFGDLVKGFEMFGFNTNENKVYLTQYVSTRGVTTNEDGLYAAKKLGYSTYSWD